uniref:Hes family bHLH transcription factor 3 n=1 Tax=Pelusios castaneus TaxID=367368 RepID=A0A8C8VNK0_9SAUR
MEKKRRARINVSLEQLKALLEKHYSHQIRKRKLEKADILELSVKYMRSLQHSAPGKPSADYQAGFRSCLHGVNQFLLRSEEASEAPCFHLLQELARALPAASEQGAHLPRPFTQPRARGPPSAQPAERPGSRARTDGPEPGGSREQRPCAAGSQALWRPW